MGQDGVVLPAGLDRMDQVAVEVTVVAPCCLSRLGSSEWNHVLALIHLHQECQSVEHTTSDAFSRFDLGDVLQDVIGISNLHGGSEAITEGDFLQVGVQVHHAFLRQIAQGCGLAGIRLAHDQNDVLVLCHRFLLGSNLCLGSPLPWRNQERGIGQNH